MQDTIPPYWAALPPPRGGAPQVLIQKQPQAIAFLPCDNLERSLFNAAFNIFEFSASLQSIWVAVSAVETACGTHYTTFHPELFY